MMNNVTHSADVTVVNRMMSDENFVNMWLHVLLLSVVMGVGVPGNVLVMSVFFRSQRRRQYNSTQLLVLALALNDFLVCVLLLPFDLYRLRHFYSVRDEVACDFFESIRNLNICVSCFLLTTTAVERYRAICSDLFAQAQGRRGTVLIIVVLLVVSFLLSSPTPTFLGIQERVVPPMLVAHFSVEVQKAYRQYSGQALMFSCEYLDKHDHTWGLRLFGLSSLLLFLAVVVVSIGSYGKIYHKIKSNHTSLHTAMNKVAPMVPASQSHQTPAEDGHPRRLYQSQAFGLKEQSPHSARRTPVGIFTISDTRGCSEQPLRQHSSGEVVFPDANPFQGRPFPQRLSSDGLKGVSDSQGKLPPEMSESVLCSDEKDIDVTVNARDDVMSAYNDEQSRTVLADVLSELQSVTDDADMKNDVMDCYKTERLHGSSNINNHSSFKTGALSDPLKSRGESDSRVGNNVQQPSLIKSGVQPNYDIFTVSGKQPGSAKEQVSTQNNRIWRRKQKQSKIRLPKPGRSQGLNKRSLSLGIDQRVAPVGIYNHGFKGKRRNVTRITVNRNGHPDTSGYESDYETNSSHRPRDEMTSPQDCRKHMTSSGTHSYHRSISTITQNCRKHLSVRTEDVDESVISTNTENRNNHMMLKISKDSGIAPQIVDTDVQSTSVHDVDIHKVSKNLPMSCQDSAEKTQNKNYSQKPEIFVSARNSSGRSSSGTALTSARRVETENLGVTIPDQHESLAPEIRPSACDSSSPPDILFTKTLSFSKTTSSIQFNSEYQVQPSSSSKTDVPSDSVIHANSKPVKSNDHESFVRKESDIAYKHQQSEHSNEQKTPSSFRGLYTLSRSTTTVKVNNTWQQQTRQLKNQNANKNTERVSRTNNSLTDNHTTSVKFLGESRSQNKLRTSVRVQNSHNARFARQIRVAKILLVVTGTFLMSFVPFWVLTVVYMVRPHLDWELSLRHRMFMSVLYQFYFVNNAANPVLFALYSPEFRSECRLLFKDFKKKLCG